MERHCADLHPLVQQDCANKSLETSCKKKTQLSSYMEWHCADLHPLVQQDCANKGVETSTITHTFEQSIQKNFQALTNHLPDASLTPTCFYYLEAGCSRRGIMENMG